MKKLTILLAALFLLIALSENFNAQGRWGRIGKLYSKDKALELYGPVKQAAKMETAKLKEVLNKAGDYVLFSLKEGKLKIYNSKRVELYPEEGNTVDEKESLRVYSTSLVLETIDTGTVSETTIETRDNVMTITNGESTLEFTVTCPPYCD